MLRLAHEPVYGGGAMLSSGAETDITLTLLVLGKLLLTRGWKMAMTSLERLARHTPRTRR